MALSKTQEREQTEFSNRPQPIDGKMGATIIGPTNPTREAENPDTLAPPRVDHGTMANLRWSCISERKALGIWKQMKTIERPGMLHVGYVPREEPSGGF
jgi:hypothetical protein